MTGITFKAENGVHFMRVTWGEDDADLYRLLRSQPAKLPQLDCLGMIFQATNGRYFQTARLNVKGITVGVAWPVSDEEQAHLERQEQAVADEAAAEAAYERHLETDERYRYEAGQDELRASWGL